MAENAVEKVLEIKVRYDDAIRKIAEYRKQLDVLKQVEKTLKEDVEKGRISRDAYNIKLTETKIATQEYNDSIRVLNKEIQNNIKAEKQQENSLVALRASLSNLTRQYDEMSEAERNSAAGQDLEIHINAITDKIAEEEEKTQRFFRSVGKYQEAFEKALSPLKDQLDELMQAYIAMSEEERKSAAGEEMRNHIAEIREELKATTEAGGKFQNELLSLVGVQNGFLGKISGLVGGINSVSAAFKAGRVAAIAFGKQMLALLLNPVILTITALVTALYTLKAAFESVNNTIKGSEELNYKYQKAMSLNSAIADGFTRINEKIAKTYIKIANSINMALAKFYEWSGLVPGAKKVVEDYMKIEEDRYNLSVNIRKANEQAADNDLKISELRDKIAKKDKYTHKERIAFLDEAIKLETSNAEKRKELAEENLRILETVGQRTLNSAEYEEKLSQARIDVARATIDLNNKTRELNAQRVEAINSQKTEAKEAVKTAKERKDKEIEAYREAQDILLSLIKDNSERQRQQLKVSYEREIEDLKRKLTDEKNLTLKAKDNIREAIKLKEQQQQRELQKLSNEQYQIEIEKRQRLIETQLGAVKSGSEQEYQLQMQNLVTQRELELSELELTEQMKAAIRAKYNKQLDDLVNQRNAYLLSKEQEAIRIRFETEIATLRNNETEILKVKVEQRKTELDTLQQMEGEKIEAFNLRKLEAENAYLDAQKALKDKEVAIEQAKYEAVAQITGGLISLTEQLGESNEGLAKFSKILALGEIAVNTGKAIAAGVAQAQSVPFPGNIAAIATTVATILANIATAIKTVKSAKFATGGLVTGPGTGTSDSIPAQLSNGESVMTARTTELFAPILSSFNQMGGGVPINITASSNQTMGEDMLARAVAKGVQMMPNPVVSVTEINTVGKRVEVLENLGSL
jgi:bll1643 protein